MDQATIDKFTMKNEAVVIEGRDRLWVWEPIAERGYYACTLPLIDDEFVRTQEDMVMLWGYSQYLMDVPDDNDSADDEE